MKEGVGQGRLRGVRQLGMALAGVPRTAIRNVPDASLALPHHLQVVGVS